jgi:hypothetical protein
MDPGATTISVTTPDGSTTSDDHFSVSPPPVISELDPFGFSRDPSGRDITIDIRGSGFILQDGDVVRVVCRLEPRFNPNMQVEPSFVDLMVVSSTPTTILVSVPSIPDFDARFVGGHGSVSVNCSDGSVAESDRWPIEGL